MRHSVAAVTVALVAALAAGVAAIPIAAYAGATLAAAVDSEARDGLGLRVVDGVVSTSIAFVIFAPVVVGLVVAATGLVGVRSRFIRFATPLGLIVLHSLPAALLVVRIAPDPAPVHRLNEPVLARITPPAGATSRPARTFNASSEWESRDWVTRRVDVLSAQTTATTAIRYYRGALRSAGWQIESILALDTRQVSIWGRRPGRRIKATIETGAVTRVELDLR